MYFSPKAAAPLVTFSKRKAQNICVLLFLVDVDVGNVRSNLAITPPLPPQGG